MRGTQVRGSPGVVQKEYKYDPDFDADFIPPQRVLQEMGRVNNQGGAVNRGSKSFHRAQMYQEKTSPIEEKSEVFEEVYKKKEILYDPDIDCDFRRPEKEMAKMN